MYTFFLSLYITYVHQNDAFVFYSDYVEEQLVTGHNFIVEQLVQPEFEQQYIYKKYTSKRFLKAAVFASDWAHHNVAQQAATEEPLTERRNSIAREQFIKSNIPHSQSCFILDLFQSRLKSYLLHPTTYWIDYTRRLIESNEHKLSATVPPQFSPPTLFSCEPPFLLQSHSITAESSVQLLAYAAACFFSDRLRRQTFSSLFCLQFFFFICIALLRAICVFKRKNFAYQNGDKDPSQF